MMTAQPALALLRAQLAAATANVMARILGLIGLGLISVGAIIGLSAWIGPAPAFGLCGAVLAGSAALFIAAQQRRVVVALPQSAAPPTAPDAAAQVAFVLGFVAIRALLAKNDRRRS